MSSALHQLRDPLPSLDFNGSPQLFDRLMPRIPPGGDDAEPPNPLEFTLLRSLENS